MNRFRVVAAALLLTACASDASGPGEPQTPYVEFVAVDPALGERGVTVVGWKHPKGYAALGEEDGQAMFRAPSGDGVLVLSMVRPASVRRVGDVMEVVFHGGRDATSASFGKTDGAERNVLYDCTAPAWQCVKNEALSYPNR